MTAVETENPLLEGLRLRRTPEPCVVTIFGASGDLTQKKLLPALYSLAFRRLLPGKFSVVGVARTEESDEEFKARMKEAVQKYGRGYVEGEEVPGYREEERVDPQSMTETYVAAKLYVDNWRWADTPFYVRMGKRLPRRETTIAIEFKRAPHPPFEELAAEGLRPNVLLVNVQPDEGVSLAIGAKVPGQGMTIRTVHMDFLYGGAFRTGLPEAYERLILDAMLGDATLFTRIDEVLEQWSLVDAIVAAWVRDRPGFPNYPAGTWGPPSADELLKRDGRSWRRH